MLKRYLCNSHSILRSLLPPVFRTSWLKKLYLDFVAAIQSGLVAASGRNATLMNIMTHSCVSCFCWCYKNAASLLMWVSIPLHVNLSSLLIVTLYYNIQTGGRKYMITPLQKPVVGVYCRCSSIQGSTKWNYSFLFTCCWSQFLSIFTTIIMCNCCYSFCDHTATRTRSNELVHLQLAFVYGWAGTGEHVKTLRPGDIHTDLERLQWSQQRSGLCQVIYLCNLLSVT